MSSFLERGTRRRIARFQLRSLISKSPENATVLIRSCQVKQRIIIMVLRIKAGIPLQDFKYDVFISTETRGHCCKQKSPSLNSSPVGVIEIRIKQTSKHIAETHFD